MRIETLYQHFLDSSGICTDTRNITKNCFFVALTGDNFNGNEFAQEALDKGAYKVLIDEMKYHKNTGETILHSNALKLLQKLATYHRKQLGIPIISITGSNGKTTTKELINVVLSTKFKTTATKGNLNNHIGVPLTLLSMTSETELGIVEMGANHQKEIEGLCDIALPDFGLITNFGKAHLEGFGGIEGVIKGKSELYKHIATHDKMAFVNGNDPRQLLLTKTLNRYTFGNENQDCNIRLLNAETNLIIDYKKRQIESHLIGTYNFHNIAAAIAIGEYFDVTTEDIASAISSYIPKNNRSQIIKKGLYNVLLDAYNANPTSMMAALENFEQTSEENKTLFLGDMFEVGLTADEEHQNISNFCEQHKFDRVYLIGEHFLKTMNTSKNIVKCGSFEELKSTLSTTKPKPGGILIKASRGMALERILELL